MSRRSWLAGHVRTRKQGGRKCGEGAHHGAWIDGGTLYTDATRAYQVAVAGLLERAEDIRRAVERARVHYRQEAIYVSYLGTAEILGPSA